MNTDTIKLKNMAIGTVELGLQGENESRQIVFDCKEVFEEYPQAVPALTVTPPEGESYPAVVERDEDMVKWTITSADLAYHGNGEIQLKFTEGEAIRKSYRARTEILESIEPTGEAPEPVQNWIDEAQNVLETSFPRGGRATQVLAKASDKDHDTEWVDMQGGGGGGGTYNYNALTHKPAIDGITLDEDSTLESIGAVSADDLPDLMEGKMNKPATDGTAGQVLRTNGDGTTSWDDDANTETIIEEVDDWLDENITNPDSPPLDRSLSSSSAAAPADMVGDLQSELNELPKIVETLEDTAELYFADTQGNVIAQFSDGHIQTKNFDSSDTPTNEDLEQLSEDVADMIQEEIEAAIGDEMSKIPKVALTTGSDAALDIADTQGKVLVRFKNGHIQTKNFDSSNIKTQGFEWKFSGNDLLIGYGYNDTIDAVVVLNEGRANGLFDFAKLCSKPKGTTLADIETADLTTIWSSSTDMHGPFQFLAVNNADGEHASATDPGFTGGNHTLDSLGSNWKTASSKGVRYFADGHQVTSGNGWCNRFEIRWANGVQAYNTAKEGGTGRECMIEYHDMIFDGVRFDEHIRLVPTEDIKMKLWYGLQFVGFGSIYTSICFRDAVNRETYTNPESTVKSGNATTSAMLAYGTNDAIELTVDTATDLGTRNGFYSGDSGAFVSPSIHKGYFNIINKSAKVDMAANTNWFLNGSFRFFSK